MGQETGKGTDERVGEETDEGAGNGTDEEIAVVAGEGTDERGGEETDEGTGLFFFSGIEDLFTKFRSIKVDYAFLTKAEPINHIIHGESSRVFC